MSCADYITPVKLYLSRDNAVTVVPYSDYSERVNYDMTAVTRVVANADLLNDVTVGNSVTGDSDTDPNKVFWDNNNTANEWRIYAKVGLFTGIVAGTYTVRITIYDPNHPNGLVLPDSDSALQVEIVALP